MLSWIYSLAFKKIQQQDEFICSAELPAVNGA